jgi:murein DD-endopeptidase MepM/ murein hydrolase activator NlpD
VRAGQTIAGIGKRGNSTGYHLHFEVNVPTEGEIRALNPAEWLQSK